MIKPLTLHPEHELLGAQFGQLGGAEVVWTYGALQQEYQAARTGAALVDLSQRELLRLSGGDRASFLHGMVTNDVKGLPEGRILPAALLTAKGAMVSDVLIWRRPDDLLLELEPALSEKVKQFLESYLISEEADLAGADSELALLGVLGPKARTVLKQAMGMDLSALAARAFHAVPFEGQTVWILADDAWVPGSLKLLLPRAFLSAAWNHLKAIARPAGYEALELLRVEAGAPRYGLDMDDKTIPLEANLEGSIHYNKGCYIGQEVIARATFRGHVNRKLAGLLLGAANPAPKTELYKGEKKVGWLTSVVHSYALGQFISLGYVHRDFLAPGTELTLADGSAATVHSLPFVKA